MSADRPADMFRISPDPEAPPGRSAGSDMLVDKLRLSRRNLVDVLDRIKTTSESAAWWSGDEREVWIQKTERQIADIDSTIDRYDRASRPRPDTGRA